MSRAADVRDRRARSTSWPTKPDNRILRVCARRQGTTSSSPGIGICSGSGASGTSRVVRLADFLRLFPARRAGAARPRSSRSVDDGAGALDDRRRSRRRAAACRTPRRGRRPGARRRTPRRRPGAPWRTSSAPCSASARRSTRRRARALERVEVARARARSVVDERVEPRRRRRARQRRPRRRTPPPPPGSRPMARSTSRQMTLPEPSQIALSGASR